jgi:hypothetical protein
MPAETLPEMQDSMAVGLNPGSENTFKFGAKRLWQI